MNKPIKNTFQQRKTPCASQSIITHNKTKIKPLVLQSGMPSQQQGATLIIVLMILILVSGIAAVTIRNSNTDLKLATADQVEKVMFQANDAAFIKLEKEDRIKSKSTSLTDLKGYITSDNLKPNESIALCVRPKETYLFSLSRITKTDKKGRPYPAYKKGYCNPDVEADYVNKGRVITQMTFVKGRLPDADKSPFNNETQGSNSNDREYGKEGKTDGACETFIAYSTSVIPALTNAASKDILACFKKGYWNEENNDTVDDCLEDIGAAFETHMQIYQNVPTSEKCV